MSTVRRGGGPRSRFVFNLVNGDVVVVGDGDKLDAFPAVTHSHAGIEVAPPFGAVHLLHMLYHFDQIVVEALVVGRAKLHRVVFVVADGAAGGDAGVGGVDAEVALEQLTREERLRADDHANSKDTHKDREHH